MARERRDDEDEGGSRECEGHGVASSLKTNKQTNNNKQSKTETEISIWALREVNTRSGTQLGNDRSSFGPAEQLEPKSHHVETIMARGLRRGEGVTWHVRWREHGPEGHGVRGSNMRWDHPRGRGRTEPRLFRIIAVRLGIWREGGRERGRERERER